MIIREAQDAFRRQLSPVSDTASLDAQVLLASILDKPRAWVMAHPEQGLNPSQIKSYSRILDRLNRGEPVPYILGRWEFYGLDFAVTPDVLIPRPETELLVEHALSWLHANPNRRRAADIGTGSGCIAIALASKVPDLTVVAGDISIAALEIARQNISRYHLGERIFPVQTDLLTAFSPPPQKKFDLICANLPYISDNTLAALDRLRWEPAIALSGGGSGTDFIQRTLADTPRVLDHEGLLLLEIEASQGEIVPELVSGALPVSSVSVQRDLAGQDRLVIVQTGASR